MLQRNTTDHPLDVPAASATVQPGETLDWPDPVMGFEPVPSPAKTTKSIKGPAQPADEGAGQ